jgi:hypothetical protein
MTRKRLLHGVNLYLSIGFIIYSFSLVFDSIPFYSSNFYLSLFISIFFNSDGIIWEGTPSKCFYISTTSSMVRPLALGSSFYLKYLVSSNSSSETNLTLFFFFDPP